MIKKPIRKIQLSRETIRIMAKDQLPRVAGGVSNITGDDTCTLHEGTGPFPSHGPCGGSIIFV